MESKLVVDISFQPFSKIRLPFIGFLPFYQRSFSTLLNSSFTRDWNLVIYLEICFLQFSSIYNYDFNSTTHEVHRCLRCKLSPYLVRFQFTPSTSGASVGQFCLGMVTGCNINPLLGLYSLFSSNQIVVRLGIAFNFTSMMCMNYLLEKRIS